MEESKNDALWNVNQPVRWFADQTLSKVREGYSNVDILIGYTYF